METIAVSVFILFIVVTLVSNQLANRINELEDKVEHLKDIEKILWEARYKGE